MNDLWKDQLMVYFASLADYNAGVLHGTWVNIGNMVDVDDLRDEIQHMLEISEQPDAEEWAIHDISGFGPLRIPEYFDLEKLLLITENALEYGKVYLHFLNYHDIDEGLQINFEEAYRGTWKKRGEYVEHLVTGGSDKLYEELGWVYRYIDWEGAWRELECGEHYSIKVDWEYAIFRSY